MSSSFSIDSKVQDIEARQQRLAQESKMLAEQKKLAAQLKVIFPNAIYGVRPDGSSGYMDRSINVQTRGAVKRHTYSAEQKRYQFYYELNFKVGKANMILTSEVQGSLSSSQVCELLDQVSVKKPSPPKKEVEVTPHLGRET
jgi:hypothetical protein